MPGEAVTASDPLVKLRAIVDAFPGQGFAVVDGGHFPDLPAVFRRERLFARSLFLENADREVQAAGPWLVALDQAPDATENLFALVGDKPAAVFWCCDAGETVLWRHLRGLNMARIPKWAADGQRLPPSDLDENEFETVAFRHYDPRVLAALLPCLEAAQFARITGDASEIALCSPDFGGARRVQADEGWPAPPRGLLTITSQQASALNERRLAASHGRILQCLRELEPNLVATIPPEHMAAHVATSDRLGRELGISSEAAHGKWAYLMLMTQGRVYTSPQARAFVAKGARPPDEQINFLIDYRERWLVGSSLPASPLLPSRKGRSRPAWAGSEGSQAAGPEP